MKEVKTAKEKVVSFLNEIDDIRQITAVGKPIRISYEQASEKGFDEHFVYTFLKKLEHEKIIRIIHLGTAYNLFYQMDAPRGHPDEHYHVFELKDEFDSYLTNVVSNHIPVASSHNHEKGLKISYSENTREIVLNDLFLISKPDFDSENEKVFYYLYRNPNKIVTKTEIAENFNANQTLTKDFHKIVENLKFKKDLRKAFFDISQDSIKFFNPVSQERLQELGIKNIPIKSE